ncbi:hypothetical protein pfor_33c3180 [Rhodobacteraceae bacterium SB2]|nr:hypothetical protein pfor_33c3180 [Rhodobacteraceae bacterium SB2]
MPNILWRGRFSNPPRLFYFTMINLSNEREETPIAKKPFGLLGIIG